MLYIYIYIYIQRGYAPFRRAWAGGLGSWEGTLWSHVGACTKLYCDMCYWSREHLYPCRHGLYPSEMKEHLAPNPLKGL